MPQLSSDCSLAMNRSKDRSFWNRLPGRFRRGALVAFATVLIGWTAAWSQTPPPARLPVNPETASLEASRQRPRSERLREGTELKDVQGYFRFVEDRVVFFRSNGDARYIGLENLNLERIVKEITNNPTQLEWNVFGTVTEYQGANYLLIRRAVLSRSNSDLSSPLAPPGAE